MPKEFTLEEITGGRSQASEKEFSLEEIQKPKSKEEVNIGKAALQGFGQGATFGYLPQAQAGLGALIEKFLPQDAIDKKLSEQGFKIKGPDTSYVAQRDRFIREGKKLQEESPTAYGAGELAGVLGSSILPAKAALSLGGVSGGLLAKSIPQAAVAGAIQGALQNPGDVEGEISGIQLSDRAKNASLNAVLGGAIGGLGEGIKKAAGSLGKIPENIRKFSQEHFDFRAIGATPGDIPKLTKRYAPEEVSKYIRDKGLAKAGFDVRNAAEKAQSELESTGKKLGGLMDALEAKGEVTLTPSKEVINTALNNLDDVVKRYPVEGQEILDNKMVSRYLTDLEKKESYSVKDLLSRRQEIDKKIYKARGDRDDVTGDALESIRNTLNELIEKRAGEGRAKELKSLRKDYAIGKTVADITQKRSEFAKGGSLFSLLDLLAGSAGVAGGSYAGEDPASKLAGGALLGAAFAGGRRFGPGIASSGLRGLASLLERPAALSKAAAGPISEIDASKLPSLLRLLQDSGFTENAAQKDTGKRDGLLAKQGR